VGMRHPTARTVAIVAASAAARRRGFSTSQGMLGRDPLPVVVPVMSVPALEASADVAGPPGWAWARSSVLPEHRVLRLPSLAPTSPGARVLAWNVKEGDAVDPYGLLCVVGAKDGRDPNVEVRIDVGDCGGCVARLLSAEVGCEGPIVSNGAALAVVCRHPGDALIFADPEMVAAAVDAEASTDFRENLGVARADEQDEVVRGGVGGAAEDAQESLREALYAGGAAVHADGDSRLATWQVVLTFAGGAFSGWQSQSLRGFGHDKISTVQGEVEQALRVAMRDKGIKVIGASRTDSGVHARSYSAHFRGPRPVLPGAERTLVASLNGILPRTVRCLAAREVHPQFHARYSALGKVYLYRVISGPCHDPLGGTQSTYESMPLDVWAMRSAARAFIGTHDFSSFQNAYSDKRKVNPIRNISRCDVLLHADLHSDTESFSGVEGAFQVVDFIVEGRSFLYKMVRNMVGALLEVGRGRQGEDFIEELLLLRDRAVAAERYDAAPGKGLTLQKVLYPPASLIPPPRGLRADVDRSLAEDLVRVGGPDPLGSQAYDLEQFLRDERLDLGDDGIVEGEDEHMMNVYLKNLPRRRAS